MELGDSYTHPFLAPFRTDFFNMHVMLHFQTWTGDLEARPTSYIEDVKPILLSILWSSKDNKPDSKRSPFVFHHNCLFYPLAIQPTGYFKPHSENQILLQSCQVIFFFSPLYRAFALQSLWQHWPLYYLFIQCTLARKTAWTMRRADNSNQQKSGNADKGCFVLSCKDALLHLGVDTVLRSLL